MTSRDLPKHSRLILDEAIREKYYIPRPPQDNASIKCLLDRGLVRRATYWLPPSNRNGHFMRRQVYVPTSRALVYDETPAKRLTRFERQTRALVAVLNQCIDGNLDPRDCRFGAKTTAAILGFDPTSMAHGYLVPVPSEDDGTYNLGEIMEAMTAVSLGRPVVERAIDLIDPREWRAHQMRCVARRRLRAETRNVLVHCV